MSASLDRTACGPFGTALRRKVTRGRHWGGEDRLLFGCAVGPTLGFSPLPSLSFSPARLPPTQQPFAAGLGCFSFSRIGPFGGLLSDCLPQNRRVPEHAWKKRMCEQMEAEGGGSERVRAGKRSNHRISPGRPPPPPSLAAFRALLGCWEIRKAVAFPGAVAKHQARQGFAPFLWEPHRSSVRSGGANRTACLPCKAGPGGKCAHPHTQSWELESKDS